MKANRTLILVSLLIIILSVSCKKKKIPTTVIPETLSIGTAYQGGKIAYILQPGDIGYDANVQHGIIAATSDQSTGAEWGYYGSLISGADGQSIGAGPQNTIDIINGCLTPGIAADICGDLVLFGYTDWYLPSAEELHKMVGVTALNLSTYYHSSTEYNSTNAIYEGLTIGDFYRTPGTGSYPSGTTKTGNPLNVRAIRSF